MRLVAGLVAPRHFPHPDAAGAQQPDQHPRRAVRRLPRARHGEVLAAAGPGARRRQRLLRVPGRHEGERALPLQAHLLGRRQ